MKKNKLRWIAAAALVAGCGGSDLRPAGSPVLGPHQGRLLKLPDDLGFAEVVVESSGRSPRSLTTEVATYFFGPDSQGPLIPPPTDVSLMLYLGESKTRETVALKPAAKAGAPESAGRFAAVPPPGFDGLIASGKLAARHQGREIDIPF
jgi:hypothetical protein